MKRVEVNGAVRPLYGSLGVRGLIMLTVREIMFPYGESDMHQGNEDFDKTATSLFAAKIGTFNIQQPHSTRSILAFI